MIRIGSYEFRGPGRPPPPPPSAGPPLFVQTEAKRGVWRHNPRRRVGSAAVANSRVILCLKKTICSKLGEQLSFEIFFI